MKTIATLLLLLATAQLGAAEEHVPPDVHCIPVTQRAGETLGCFITGSAVLGELRAGESGIVPQGPPMMLVGIGKGVRRALVLILHDSAQPSTIPASDWTPPGSCLKGS